MSKRKRRHLTATFKARIAKEALQEIKTIQQIAQENDIAPSQVPSCRAMTLPCHSPSLAYPTMFLFSGAARELIPSHSKKFFFRNTIPNGLRCSEQ